MITDTLIVDTRRVYKPHSSSEPLNITVEGQESIFWIKPGQREKPGTFTKLILRKNKNPWDRMTEDEFIKAVETVIPNPPVKIIIETTSHKKIRDENSFRDITALSLKDYSWEKHENIRTFEISLDKKEHGIIGSTIVAILESHDKPVEAIDITSKEVEIDGESYSLSRKVSLSENKIIEQSSSITINDDGEIRENDSTQYLVSSKSRMSLHGIEVPTTLFPEFWNVKNNQVRISWPFPLIIVMDVCGNRDLDLNSSRTQIIMSEKWLTLEEDLAYFICSEIAISVSEEYWNALKEILMRKAKNDSFINGINRVQQN